MLGRIYSSLPIIYRLVDFKHLKNNCVLTENESNQQLYENIQFKIRLAAEHQDLWKKKCSPNKIFSQTLRFLARFLNIISFKKISSLILTSGHPWNHLKRAPRPFKGPLVHRAGRRARDRKAQASSHEPRNKRQWRGSHAELRTSHIRPARLPLMAETYKIIPDNNTLLKWR